MVVMEDRARRVASLVTTARERLERVGAIHSHSLIYLVSKESSKSYVILPHLVES